MLTQATTYKKCDICGREYIRLLEQDMMRYCEKCGYSGYVCDSCAAKGCPYCGGKLVSVWEKIPGIMF